MQSADELNPTIRKLVIGLRQVATDLVGRGERDVPVLSEEHGYDLEAMPQYADRINGYATELAQAIGYIEPSAELVAAREMAAKVFERHLLRPVRVAPGMTYTNGRGVALAIREGALDRIDVVQDLLQAVYAGRALAEADARKQRIADMLRPPVRESYRVPDRLTVTIEGPQASGKTRVARWIISKVAGYVGLNPLVIEIGSDGRRFDVRNEVFLDAAEADHG